MRAAQERIQERLPPKKRDLPSAAGGEDGGGGRGVPGGAGGGEASAPSSPSPSEWPRGGGGAPPHYGEGGAAEGVASLTVDQFGLLYKVAVPPVVSVSPLPPAFSVASPLLQHPHSGLPYSPLHYAQLPPSAAAPLHFVGSPYSVPYALPPGGFFPTASRIPHLVPFTPLLLEEAGPPAHTFGKTTAAPLSLQPHGGSQLLDVGQGRFPVQYQLSHLPTGYSAFEVPVADPTLALPLQDPKLITANGVGRPQPNEVLDMGSGSAEGQLPGTTTAEPTADSRFLASCPSLRTEVAMTSQRSTPDTDLEVQRVVGMFASSQDHLACSGQQKGGGSPLNLSHRALPGQGDGSGRSPGRAAAAERSLQQKSSSAKSLEEELLPRHQILANGRALLPAAPDGLGGVSPEAPAQGGLPDPDSAPSPGQLPSHFMKGAIIQLATGELKRVEDLQTQDFVRSAEVSGGLKIDSSTVVDLQESPWQGFVTLHFVVGEQQSKVSIDVPPEHPFFVYGQGWSSCSPERTARLFALPCHQLQVGDVCISISLQSLNGRLAVQATPGPSRERLGRDSQSFREAQARAGSPMQKGGAAVSLGSPQYGWAGPSFQRPGEEPRSPSSRPSFIPQEVKLSIEGRSNAGK
ncbi:ataxin-1-like [Heteronotia binoei]|uniref:ataxin-1-like n=1 Tax=Heteronotia binoei TaxID=13085 RepID=UPI00293064F1|nr:ataxin-1-like [Heteronotia binoei]